MSTQQFGGETVEEEIARLKALGYERRTQAQDERLEHLLHTLGGGYRKRKLMKSKKYKKSKKSKRYKKITRRR